MIASLSNPAQSESVELKAIFLLGTLNPPDMLSRTLALCKFLAFILSPYGIKNEIVRLGDFSLRPQPQHPVSLRDDWPLVLKKMLSADILIFATPIIWKSHSSLIQMTLERLDALNDKLMETGEGELANKVAGLVITGDEDGAQQVIGTLANFFCWNSLTMPPSSALFWLNPREKNETETELFKKFHGNSDIKITAEVMARNLNHYARLLKKYPLPTNEKDGLILPEKYPLIKYEDKISKFDGEIQ